MKKIFWSMLLVAVTFSACTKPAEGEPDKPNPGGTEEPDKPKPPVIIEPGVAKITSLDRMAIAKDMGSGWNLGNTFDTRSTNKKLWGRPTPTKALIDGVADAGFKTLRIPVTWYPDLGARIGDAGTKVGEPKLGNKDIADQLVVPMEFMMRIEEVAKWALARDMYVIINTHHDEQWFMPKKGTPYDDVVDEATKNIATVWSQIAKRLQRFGDHVIFETLNEPRVHEHPKEWEGGDAEGRAYINALNEAALKAIRKTGGNNRLRAVMLPQWGANTAGIADLDLFDDPNVIVAVHAYDPYAFCLAPDDFPWKQYGWGTASDKAGLDNMFRRIHDLYTSKGIPAVMGEWGASTRKVPDNLGGGTNEEDCIRHHTHYAEGCRKNGIVPVLWIMGYIDANNGKVKRPEIVKAVTEAGNLWLEDNEETEK